MKEFLKRVKADMIVSAILCMALGVVLFVWSEQTIDIICKALAIILVVMGVVRAITFLRDREKNVITGAVGLIELLVGIWIFLRPESIVSLIPIVIGVILLVHGLADFRLAFETKGNGYETWWSILIMAFISVIFGVICIVDSFGVVSLAMKFIGVALVYDGISDLWIVTRATKAAKEFKQAKEAVDVDYKEIDE